MATSQEQNTMRYSALKLTFPHGPPISPYPTNTSHLVTAGMIQLWLLSLYTSVLSLHYYYHYDAKYITKNLENGCGKTVRPKN